MRAMSNDRDINDILDSLNQLLREGESHNDDHVETDDQIDEKLDEHAEEIEAELHELEEDDAAPEEAVVEAQGAESEEATEQPESEQIDDIDDSSDDELSSEYLDDLDEDSTDEDSADESIEEELREAPISVQRVVLTEEMLVNNPQGNLLSIVKEGEEAGVEQVTEPESVEDEIVEAVQEDSFEEEEPSEHEPVDEIDEQVVHDLASENQDSNSVNYPSDEQLEQLVERVSDDVISRLQQELPSLISASLHRCLTDLRDEEPKETDQSENHSEE